MSLGTRRLIRAGAVAVAAAVMSGIAAVPLAAPAAAGYTPPLSSFDARLLADINHARAAHGLRGLTAVAGMMLLNRLPMPYHPLFNVPRFARATQDRFFLAVEATDTRFDRRATAELLHDLGATEVSEVAR